MTWSRNYSPENTRRLRRLIRTGRIVVDIERGLVLWPNGKPIHSRENSWGYVRFQIRFPGMRKTNWFFVHKAIMLAQGTRLLKDHEINHINHIPNDNRAANLEFIHRRENIQKRRVGSDVEPAF